MKQEREVPLLQLNSGDRLKTLQQLKGHLNPFREGREAEKLRAVGLKNLCLQMSDPSIEFIEKVSTGLGGVLTPDLQQLQSDIYQAGENPEKFFVERGATIGDPEKLREGISNSGLLMSWISSRYDYKNGKIDLDGKSPKVFAETIHEQIQISKEERQLERAMEQIRSEPDLEKRYRMASGLKRKVLDYARRFSFKFKNTSSSAIDKSFEPTWENLDLYSGYSVELTMKDGGSLLGSFSIEDAVRMSDMAASRYQVEKKLEQLPIKNTEQFNKLRLQYGAKAANLLILSELVDKINRVRKDGFRAKLAVPDFRAVSVELYQSWKEGNLTDDKLRPYFEWANGLKQRDWGEERAGYIIRSSAVSSEDGENTTGAGIYRSIRVDAGTSFQDFKKAVIEVYESTNSPQAQAYRVQNGIEKEEMGLIIQKYVEPEYRFSRNGQSQEGYINSRLTGIPQLMEVVTKTSRNFIKRDKLDFFLTLRPHSYSFRDRFSEEIHHFPPDRRNIDPDLPINVAQFAFIVERIWSKNVQIEFVADGLTVNFVQVRDLPKDTSPQASEVKFPDKPIIHSGASIGVGDRVLSVLSNEDDNSGKTGLVIFHGNNMWTIRKSTSNLPKDGAVIIGNYSGDNGHIQTLCAEKGLVCIFPDPSRGIETLALQGEELAELKKARIVSNGIEGRVYEAQDESMPKAGA